MFPAAVPTQAVVAQEQNSETAVSSIPDEKKASENVSFGEAGLYETVVAEGPADSAVLASEAVKSVETPVSEDDDDSDDDMEGTEGAAAWGGLATGSTDTPVTPTELSAEGSGADSQWSVFQRKQEEQAEAKVAAERRHQAERERADQKALEEAERLRREREEAEALTRQADEERVQKEQQEMEARRAEARRARESQGDDVEPQESENFLEDMDFE